MIWLYDKNGHAAAFQYDDRLISADGDNLCWVDSNHIFGISSGKHIGWYEDGVYYDIENRILLFSRDADLMYRPGLSGVPGAPGIPGRPGKPGFGGIYGRPGYSGSFSKFDPIKYFLNN